MQNRNLFKGKIEYSLKIKSGDAEIREELEIENADIDELIEKNIGIIKEFKYDKRLKKLIKRVAKTQESSLINDFAILLVKSAEDDLLRQTIKYSSSNLY
jgi:hypothetical protein